MLFDVTLSRAAFLYFILQLSPTSLFSFFFFIRLIHVCRTVLTTRLMLSSDPFLLLFTNARVSRCPYLRLLPLFRIRYGPQLAFFHLRPEVLRSFRLCMNRLSFFTFDLKVFRTLVSGATPNNHDRRLAISLRSPPCVFSSPTFRTI